MFKKLIKINFFYFVIKFIFKEVKINTMAYVIWRFSSCVTGESGSFGGFGETCEMKEYKDSEGESYAQYSTIEGNSLDVSKTCNFLLFYCFHLKSCMDSSKIACPRLNQAQFFSFLGKFYNSFRWLVCQLMWFASILEKMLLSLLKCNVVGLSHPFSLK